MKKITFFYLATCPHCIKAKKFLDELISENPKYAAIEIEYIEERKNAEIADKYDYYYVPCFYIGTEKLHEGSAKKNDIQAVLDACLA